VLTFPNYKESKISWLRINSLTTHHGFTTNDGLKCLVRSPIEKKGACFIYYRFILPNVTVIYHYGNIN